MLLTKLTQSTDPCFHSSLETNMHKIYLLVTILPNIAISLPPPFFFLPKLTFFNNARHGDLLLGRQIVAGIALYYSGFVTPQPKMKLVAKLSVLQPESFYQLQYSDY